MGMGVETRKVIFFFLMGKLLPMPKKRASIWTPCLREDIRIQSLFVRKAVALNRELQLNAQLSKKTFAPFH